MERIRVWAVDDRLYPHPHGHHRGVACRFVGRTHVRTEVTPKPRHPLAETHTVEFPAVREGEELLVGSLIDGADISPADLHRAFSHGDLTDQDPNPPAAAPEATTPSAPSSAPHVE